MSATAELDPRLSDGARRAVGLPVDRPVILFVGRIQPLKAPDVAIRALAALGAFPDAVLAIVGGASGAAGDTEAAAARRLAEELGVSERVRFVR